MTDLDRRLREFPVAPSLLSIVVVGSVLAVGAVHVHVLLTVSAVAIAGAALVLWIGRRDVVVLPAPSWVLLGLAGWSALQATPLPMGVLAKIAPKNADVWARSLRPFGESSPALASISLDPGASLVEALKWTTYAAVFALAHSAGKRDGRYWGPVVVFFSAAAVAVVTLVHGLVGAKTLFGVYAPIQAVPRWGLPPLLNPNNLSGYLNLGVFCGAGLLLTHRSAESERPLPPEWLVAAGVASVVGISVLAASRGGISALGAGAVALALLLRFARSGRRRHSTAGASRRRIAAVASALVGGVLLAAMGAGESTWAELRGSGVEKLRMLAWSKPLVADHVWFGVGRGAFETAFPAYRVTGGHTLYAHPENFVVQWVAEWGLPAAVAAFCLLAWFLRPQQLAVRGHRAALGVLAGGAVLLLQNLADLALEVPGVVIALTAAAGSIYQGRQVSEGLPTRAARWNRRLPAMVIGTVGVAAWSMAAIHGRRPVAAEREEVHALFGSSNFGDASAWTRFRGTIRAAIGRHPGDAYFLLLAAMAARRTNGVDAMPWIASALERDPKSGEAHMVLSEILARRGVRGQALMELRLAVEAEPNLANIAGQRAIHMSTNRDELMQAVPEGTVGAQVLMAMADVLLEPRHRETRGQFLSLAIERDSGLTRARVSRVEDLLAALERREERCSAADECRLRAEEEIRAIERLDDGSCAASLLTARLLVVQGKHPQATDLLNERCPRCRETARCMKERVALISKSASPQAFKDAVRAMLAVACGEPKACAQAHALVAVQHGQRGEWGAAAEQYARAIQSTETADLYLALADAAGRAGEVTRARTALRQAARLGREDPELERRLADQEVNRFTPAAPHR